jgi:hypothetical protein
MGLAQQGRLGPARTKFVVAVGYPQPPQVPMQPAELFHGETVFAGKGKAVIGVVDQGQHGRP